MVKLNLSLPWVTTRYLNIYDQFILKDAAFVLTIPVNPPARLPCFHPPQTVRYQNDEKNSYHVISPAYVATWPLSLRILAISVNGPWEKSYRACG